MDNKSRIMKGIKIIALVIYGMITIATCAGVWNFCPETFIKILAGVLLCCNGFVIYRLAMKIKADQKAAEEAEKAKQEEGKY